MVLEDLSSKVVVSLSVFTFSDVGYFSIVKETVRKRFALDDHDQKQDMMGSFIRHGITRTEAVSEATLQM